MKLVSPRRASHTYRQTLNAPAAKVFPLLCPVRELEWAEGWEPRLVVSASGVAERDCVFTTPSEGTEAIWYVTRHEPDAGLVEMLKITPGVTACRLEIRLHPASRGCAADVTYTHTSLSPAGDAFVDRFTEAYYREFMQAWERELNAFLALNA
ncbi:MAG TPA: hypothetical protein VF139_06190 [Candidatus Polarisedimenticolaceae bacterium]